MHDQHARAILEARVEAGGKLVEEARHLQAKIATLAWQRSRMSAAGEELGSLDKQIDRLLRRYDWPWTQVRLSHSEADTTRLRALVCSK